MLHGPIFRFDDPIRLLDPGLFPPLMSLEVREPALVGNSTVPGEEGAPQQPSVPWVPPLLAGVLITTIVVDVIGNLLVIVSVFRNKKLRKAGSCQCFNC